jgi:outer membrane protein TolC
MGRGIRLSGTALLAATVLVLSGHGAAGQESPPISPRMELPFSVQPDQLPGPPRVDGQLPLNFAEPPSSLPGRMQGPPRADGYSPSYPIPIDPTPGGMRTPTPGAFNPLPSRSDLLIPPATPPPPESLTPGGMQIDPLTGQIRIQPGAPGDLPELPLVSDLTFRELPFLPGVPRRGMAARAPLSLNEVLSSAERTYPPFLAYLQERNVALGDLMSAEGSFDLSVSADARNWGLGYYKRYLYDVFFEQPTQLWGAKFFAGYRLGVGDWPIYYQYLQTNGAGAYVAGMDLPILRNGRIDAKRAKLYQSELERRKVEPAISKQRITLIKDASKAYWNWVAAGQSYLVFERLMQIAKLRNDAIRRQVEERAVAPIELTDNTRVILSRQVQVLAARRRFQQATIELSLYLRDANSLPTLAEPTRLPPQYPAIIPPELARLQDDLEIAQRLRPELRVLQFQYMKVDIDRRLAVNQRLPGLNLYLYSEQNTGTPVPLRNKQPFILESSLLFEVPLQRRYAKGRELAANAQMRQVRYDQQFTRDRIIADVKDAGTALEVAHEQVERYQTYLILTRKLEEAELKRFSEGASNILFVNIREQGTADAEVFLIEATAKYFSALAEYRGALGTDALPPQSPSL